MRNFIYNKSDLLVALAIIIIAAIVISIEIRQITNYSNAKQEDTTVASVEKTEEDSATTESPSADQNTDTTPTDKNTDTSNTSNSNTNTNTNTTTTKDKTNTETGDVKIVIEEGTSTGAIAATLKEEGLITDEEAFIAFVISNDAENLLRAGTFSIPKNAGVADILSILIS
jgi:cell division protein YceG involved in septum cleavage